MAKISPDIQAFTPGEDLTLVTIVLWQLGQTIRVFLGPTGITEVIMNGWGAAAISELIFIFFELPLDASTGKENIRLKTIHDIIHYISSQW